MLCVKYVFLQHQEMHLTVERDNLESEGLRLATGKAPKNRTGFALFRSDSHGLICWCATMMKSDPYLARIEAFNLKNGGGVTIKKVQNGHNLYLTATDAPIARLNPSGTDDEMRIRFWSYRGHWKDVGDFGGIILPLEEALDDITTNGIFWTWT